MELKATFQNDTVFLNAALKSTTDFEEHWSSKGLEMPVSHFMSPRSFVQKGSLQ